MRQKTLRKVLAIALAVTMMISGVNFKHIVRADETESSTTKIPIPTNFKVINYGTYTGIYVLKFDSVENATSYKVYIDNETTAVKSVKSSGEYLTNKQLSKYSNGEHTFYLTAVYADGTESDKSEGVIVDKENSSGDDDIAQIYIETDKNVDALKINKDMGKLTASITAIDNQGKYKDIVDATNKTTIKVRGNSTALADKKAYNITFNKKKDLFGLSSAFDGTGAGAKKWSLLANAFDKSLIRNKLALDLNTAFGIPFTSQSRFVDLYLNGRYMGNYLLVESVEAGTDRVNIDSENPESDDILIELENNGKDEEGVDYLITTRYEQRFNIGSPERGDMFDSDTPEDTAAIQKKKESTLKILNGFEDALETGDFSKVEKYIDVESFVNFYLVSEIFKNQDISYSSTRFYITKKAGDENYKLYAGPAWDFDLSSGNVDPHYYGDAATDYKYWKATDMKWFDKLTSIKEFKLKVVNRFYEKMDDITALYSGDNSEINTLLKEHGNSYRRNYTAVENGGAGWSETVKDSADGYSYANIGWASFDASVNYLRDWLENRVEWLKVKWSKEYYLGEKDYEYSSTQVNENYKYDTDIKIDSVAYKNIITGNENVVASSGQNSAKNIVDGNMGTRWGSEYKDPQNIVVDLGQVYSGLKKVAINWEAANARDYIIELSTDGNNYTTAADIRDAASENNRLDEIVFNNEKTARYIRITGTARNLTYGYSIYEVAVYNIKAPILTDSLKIEGNQMSTCFGGVDGAIGIRSIYSVENAIENIKVSEAGVIYGVVTEKNPISVNDMIINSDNKYVYNCAATVKGKLDKVYGDSQTASYYARTMNISDFSAQGYSMTYYVRPYAILEDGTIAYGDIKSFSMYNIADDLYQGSKMNTVIAHNYLFNKILKIVNNNYKEVEYGWGNGIVKPSQAN